MPEGGILIRGVEERADFQVLGVPDPAKLESGIADKVRQSIKPAPFLSFHGLSVEETTVLVVEIVPLAPEQKPARFKNKAYLRQADDSP